MAPRSSIKNIRKFVISTIEKIPGFRVEYYEIVDDVALKPVVSKDESSKDIRYFECIALFAGDVRLIDNMEIRLW